MTIDGKVYAINRARAEAQHSTHTSQLVQEIAVLKQENAVMRRLMEENVMMRELLSEVVGTAVDGAGIAIALSPSWHDRAKTLLGGRSKKSRNRKQKKQQKETT